MHLLLQPLAAPLQRLHRRRGSLITSVRIEIERYTPSRRMLIHTRRGGRDSTSVECLFSIPPSSHTDIGLDSASGCVIIQTRRCGAGGGGHSGRFNVGRLLVLNSPPASPSNPRSLPRCDASNVMDFSSFACNQRLTPHHLPCQLSYNLNEICTGALSKWSGGPQLKLCVYRCTTSKQSGAL